MLTPLFGASQAALVAHARKLGALQRAAQGARLDGAGRALQVERVRKMLLAFSRDLRVVLLRLASRLQTLRFFAASKTPCPPDLAAEAMQVFAPLANRLGIWQIKWELEDLAFRFLDPEQYRTIAAAARRDARRSRGARRGDAREPGRRPRRARPRGRGAGPAEAPLQHLEEDAQEASRLRQGARRHRPARHRQGRRRVLRRARPRPRALPRDRRRARRLHRAAEGERLPVAAHRRRGRRRRRGRDPDPHRRDARARRVRRVGALGLQGSRRRQRRGQRGRLVRGEGRAGAAASSCASCSRGSATSRRRRGAEEGVSRDERAVGRGGARRLRRPHLRLHAAGRGGRAHRRGDADRLRLRRPHRSRPSLPRRQGRRRDRAAEHARCRAARWSR